MLRKQNEIIDIIMFLGDFQLTGQNLPLPCLHPNTLFDPIFPTSHHPISAHVFRAELFERVAQRNANTYLKDLDFWRQKFYIINVLCFPNHLSL